MIHTPVCDLFGIEYPIFQGGMAWIADANLAAAVSNGGGLGIISAMNAGPDYLREQIRRVRTLTAKPFGVNVMLMSPHADEVARVCAEEKVPVVTTGAGSPVKYMPMWREAGVKVVPVVASVDMAKRVARAGAAAVIAEGGESGGHVGETTTLVLVPQVSQAVDIPVLAAGGIGDGRGLAACLMLGAQGVQLGTRFLLARECAVHENYKKLILQAGDIATTVTGRRLGHPVRSLKTSFTRRYAQAERSADISDEELERMAVGALRRAVQEGDMENGCFMAGQIAGLLSREQPAAEIIREIFEEAGALLKGAARWVR